jgi:hypothetical protein
MQVIRERRAGLLDRCALTTRKRRVVDVKSAEKHAAGLIGEEI